MKELASKIEVAKVPYLKSALEETNEESKEDDDDDRANMFD